MRSYTFFVGKQNSHPYFKGGPARWYKMIEAKPQCQRPREGPAVTRASCKKDCVIYTVVLDSTAIWEAESGYREIRNRSIDRM